MDDWDSSVTESIIEHMNDDHGEALQLYLMAFCDLDKTSAENARMTDVDAQGIVVSADNRHPDDVRSTSVYHIHYSVVSGRTTLSSQSEVRSVLVDMVKLARKKLNIVK